ncbi:hypothetical protein BDW68DRAFT_178871 [Aspergillus falconensis]
MCTTLPPSSPSAQQLFVQTPGVPVTILYFDTEVGLLICGDSASRVVSRKLRRQRSRWKVHDPVLDMRVEGTINCLPVASTPSSFIQYRADYLSILVLRTFAGLVAGRLMDWNYKRNSPKARRKDEPRTRSTYEITRSRGSYTILTPSTLLLISDGWAVEHHKRPSIPLLLQALIGTKCTVVLQIFSALLVDIFPERPGTAAAANNITRFALSAAAVAALQPLSEAVGRAWLFTMLALVDGAASVIAVWMLRQWGGAWRVRREGGS